MREQSKEKSFMVPDPIYAPHFFVIQAAARLPLCRAAFRSPALPKGNPM